MSSLSYSGSTHHSSASASTGVSSGSGGLGGAWLMMDMKWNAGLIVISYFVSVQAAYTSFLILQMRFSRWMLAIGALCLSVSGIWSMHFIGMAAMTIETQVEYDVGWTVASALFAFGATVTAFLLLDWRLGKQADLEDLSLEAHVNAMRKAPHPTIALSAMLIALGVCAMHYTGMHAMSARNAVRVIDWGVVFGSCFIAIFAATAALYFAFVLPITRRFTIPTALVAGVAVCGMHYTGMYGIRYKIDPVHLAMDKGEQGNIVGLVAEIVFGSSLLSSCSLAFSSYMYRRKLKQAAKSAQSFADNIIAGRFSDLVSEHDSVAEELDSIRADPMMKRIKESYRSMGRQINLLKSFLPASVLAQFDESLHSMGPNSSISSTTTALQHPNWLEEEENIFAPKRCTVVVFESMQLPNDAQGLHLFVTEITSVLSEFLASSAGVVEILGPKRIIVSFNAHRACHMHTERAVAFALSVLKKVNGWTAVVDTATNFTGTMSTTTSSSRILVGESCLIAGPLNALARHVLKVRILLTERVAQTLDHPTILPMDLVHIPSNTTKPYLRVYTILRTAKEAHEHFRKAFTALTQLKTNAAEKLLAQIPHSLQKEELAARVGFFLENRRKKYCRELTAPWETFGMEPQLVFVSSPVASAGPKLPELVNTALQGEASRSQSLSFRERSHGSLGSGDNTPKKGNPNPDFGGVSFDDEHSEEGAHSSRHLVQRMSTGETAKTATELLKKEPPQVSSTLTDFDDMFGSRGPGKSAPDVPTEFSPTTGLDHHSPLEPPSQQSSSKTTETSFETGGKPPLAQKKSVGSPSCAVEVPTDTDNAINNNTDASREMPPTPEDDAFDPGANNSCPLFSMFAVQSAPTKEDIPKTILDIHGTSWLRSEHPAGIGATGLVYTAIGPKGAFAAVKFIPLYDEINTDNIISELETVTELQHENIVTYFTCSICPRHFGFFMEFVSGGSLRDVMRKFGRLPISLTRRFTIDMVHGMEFLHDKGLVHCDLKPDNVLITTEGIAKLADFGSSLLTTAASSCREVHDLRGTPAYIAPEVAQGHAPQPASDVWSFGILLYEMLTQGHLPWGPLMGETARSLYVQRLARGEGSFDVHIPHSVPPEAADLIVQCIQRDPSLRPTAKDLLCHSFCCT